MLCLVNKIVLDLLKWLKETSFYEKKTKIIIKIWTFAQKESSYQEETKFINFFGLRKIMDFWE